VEVPSIINNLALLALIVVLSGSLRKRWREGWKAALVQGFLFGAACIIGMCYPVVIFPGVFYDGRSIMLCLCGLFFGPLAAAVSGLMALAFRLALKGDGVLVGSLVILSAPLIGLVFRPKRHESDDAPSVLRLFLMGVAVHGVMVLTIAFLPQRLVAPTFASITVPILIVYPLVTVLIGIILSDQQQRDRYLAQLCAREEQFRTTLYSIGDGVVMTDGAGRLCHMNPVAERLTGWREQAAKGLPSSEVFHLISEETREAVPDPIAQVLRGEGARECLSHVLLVTRDGLEWPVASSGSLIRDVKGGVTGAVLVLRDESEARSSQQRLAYNEARFRSLVEHAPIGIFTAASTGSILMLNDAMARILGYPSAEKSAENDPSGEKPFYVCPERRDEFFNRLKAEGQVKGCELELMTIDRRRIWVSMTARVIERLSDGGFLVEGFCIEITERKKAELEHFRNAARMDVLLKILLYPAKNEKELLDYALEEMLALTGSKIGFIGHFDEASRRVILNSWSKETMRQCAVENGSVVFDYDKVGLWGEAIRQRRAIMINDYTVDNPLKKGLPPGHVPLSRFLAVPIFQDEKIVGVVGSANKGEDYGQEDVLHLQVLIGSVWKEVARLRMKTVTEELEGQLHQAQKMESVGRLAGGVAHDFNNVLQAMLGYSELLLEKLPTADPSRDLVREIVSEGKRAATLTSQLLAFARKQPVNPQVLQINETVESMLKLLRRLLGEDVELRWRPGDDLWPIRIDPVQLDQILANLTVNARDAIAGNGVMTIETSRAVLDSRYCMTHLDVSPGNYVVLSVRDNGCGMGKETMARLFEPFFTTKAKGKGTGLGLATVYGIVRQNEGTITVQSQPGVGTTFQICLPAYIEEPVEQSVSEVTEEAPVPDEKRTVLVVDDEYSLLYSGRMLLESLGHEVLIANGPVEALRLAEAYPGEIHILLTDVVMPQMSGRILAQRLHAQRPDMACIYMSGYTADIIAHHGVLDKGVLFLQKPFTKSALGAKIREALDCK